MTCNGAGIGQVRLGYVRFTHAYIKPKGSIFFPHGALNQTSRLYCRMKKFTH
jgi:hypothetical protein